MCLLCRPDGDFHNWIERVSNITAACLFATAICWFVFPWYASDDQLLHLAEAYKNSAGIIDGIWDAFVDNCKNIAEVPLQCLSILSKMMYKTNI